MTDNYCTISDLPTSWCGHCKGIAAERDVSPMGRFAVAHHDGSCPSCRKPIEEGQVIELGNDERWHHHECI